MNYVNTETKHITELAKLYVETYNAPPWNDKWTVPLAEKRLDEIINCRDSYGLVCYDDNEPIAMIVGNTETYYDCFQFYIKDFFVIPSRQSKGIGSLLMNELEARLTDMGVEKIYLFTSRGESTEKYYQNRGYKSWNDMVLMGKRTR